MSYDSWKTRSPDDDYGEPPEVQVACEMCGGEGEILETIHVYEAGCGFSHPDVHSKPCSNCSGVGFFICEAEGDTLLLQEWDNRRERYTGREVEVEVTYLLRGGQFGVEPGYVVMGLYF